MTDNELNALVAERVMELRNVRVMHGQTVYDMIHTYAIDNKGQETITYQPDLIPNCCNDIVDAWEVVETVPKYFEVAKTADGRYFCKIMPDRIEVEASTAPRAICLAALKAVGVEI